MRQAKKKSNKTEQEKATSLWASIDWLTIFIYVVLLALGWMSVCGACYDFDQAGSIFEFSTRSGQQIVWIGTSLLLAFLILGETIAPIEGVGIVLIVVSVVAITIGPLLQGKGKREEAAD